MNENGTLEQRSRDSQQVKGKQDEGADVSSWRIGPHRLSAQWPYLTESRASSEMLTVSIENEDKERASPAGRRSCDCHDADWQS
jgi:hypothetical protein